MQVQEGRIPGWGNVGVREGGGGTKGGKEEAKKRKHSPKMQYCDFITQIAYNHPKTTTTSGLSERDGTTRLERDGA